MALPGPCAYSNSSTVVWYPVSWYDFRCEMTRLLAPLFVTFGRSPMPSCLTVRRWCAALVACVGIGTSSVQGAPDETQLEFFETKIRPVFASHCYKCHSAEVDEPKGGLR